MTEDEAVKKWCPFARVGTSSMAGYAALNRDVIEENGDSLKFSRCIASACMAWRWGQKPDGWTEQHPGKAVRVDVPGDGFCGLAGAPHG